MGKIIAKYEIQANGGWLFNVNTSSVLQNNNQIINLLTNENNSAQFYLKNSSGAIECNTSYSSKPIGTNVEVFVNIVIPVK